MSVSVAYHIIRSTLFADLFDLPSPGNVGETDNTINLESYTSSAIRHMLDFTTCRDRSGTALKLSVDDAFELCQLAKTYTCEALEAKASEAFRIATIAGPLDYLKLASREQDVGMAKSALRLIKTENVYINRDIFAHVLAWIHPSWRTQIVKLILIPDWYERDLLRLAWPTDVEIDAVTLDE